MVKLFDLDINNYIIDLNAWVYELPTVLIDCFDLLREKDEKEDKPEELNDPIPCGTCRHAYIKAREHVFDLMEVKCGLKLPMQAFCTSFEKAKEE